LCALYITICKHCNHIFEENDEVIDVYVHTRKRGWTICLGCLRRSDHLIYNPEDDDIYLNRGIPTYLFVPRPTKWLTPTYRNPYEV
jgi:hypothetical protein